MNITLRQLGDVVIYLGALAAALTALGLLMRFAVLRPLDNRIKALAKPIHDVQSHMYPNHGGSFRDAVDETNKKIDILTERFDQHLESHK